MKLHGREAIEWAEKGFKLNKYGDPIEGPLENISVEYAEEVSREDPSLIWCEVPDSTYAGAKLGSIVTATKSAAARENGKRGGRPAPEYTYAAAYGDSIVYLSADFDLCSDYFKPKSHKARFGKRWIRVVVNHDATGTGTPGTGDTVVRSIPKGWRSGDHL